MINLYQQTINIRKTLPSYDNDNNKFRASHWKTLQNWFKSFVDNKNQIIAPLLPWSSNKKKRMSPMLQMYPELVIAITIFCRRNLNILSNDLVKEYVNKCVSIIAAYIPPDINIHDSDDSQHETEKIREEIESKDLLEKV